MKNPNNPTPLITTVKVLSVMQPWASLLVMGVKRNETRSFRSNFRGRIYIHASKTKNRSLVDVCKQAPFNKYVPDYDKLPFGKILGHVDMINCMTTEEMSMVFLQDSNRERAIEEYQFGDYSENRYAWVMENPVMLDEFISVNGTLGIWNYNLVANNKGVL